MTHRIELTTTLVVDINTKLKSKAMSIAKKQLDIQMHMDEEFGKVVEIHDWNIDTVEKIKHVKTIHDK